MKDFTVGLVRDDTRMYTRLLMALSSNNSFNEFIKAINCFREVIWKDFPDADLAIEDVALIETSALHSANQYTAARVINGN